MKRIICCDDEPHILEGVRHLLRGPDRVLEVATTGREAINLIAREIPDLLIVDVMMPEMSGLEVVAALRAEEKTKDLPIIILTAKGQAQDAAVAQEVWGATVMAKPFSPNKLRQLVETTLNRTTCKT
jgi:CheY-like chemotaxis protein